MMDYSEITSLLPHRFPFLMVDRLLEVNDDGTYIKALKNISANEPQFTGHFPSQPVMPGVLIIEALAQVCGIMWKKHLPPEKATEDKIFYFASIENARFRRMAVPGDQLILEGALINERGNFMWCDGKATVDGEVVCEVRMCCALR